MTEKVERRRKLPVVLFVAVIVIPVTVLSVGVVVTANCDPVVNVLGVVVLSITYTVTFTAQ